LILRQFNTSLVTNTNEFVLPLFASEGRRIGVGGGIKENVSFVVIDDHHKERGGGTRLFSSAVHTLPTYKN
jgi:hypothetical protein